MSYMGQVEAQLAELHNGIPFEEHNHKANPCRKHSWSSINCVAHWLQPCWIGYVTEFPMGNLIAQLILSESNFESPTCGFLTYIGLAKPLTLWFPSAQQLAGCWVLGQSCARHSDWGLCVKVGPREWEQIRIWLTRPQRFPTPCSKGLVWSILGAVPGLWRDPTEGSAPDPSIGI